MKRNPIDIIRYVFVLIIGLWAFDSIAMAAPVCSMAVAGSTQGLHSGASNRDVSIHWPKGLSASSPAPLVFLFHGSGGSGPSILKAAQLEATADRHGFIIVAPNGGIALTKSADQGFVWAIPGVPTTTGHIPDANDPDDVACVAEIIDTLVSKGCVDATRVFATGLSGGGRMASLLGCVMADKIAAIAPVVGLRAGIPRKGATDQPDPYSCRPRRPMPILAFAGDADTTNPIAGGGAPYWQYSLHAAEQRWAVLNGCSNLPTTQWVSDHIYEERFGGCRDQADVATRITVGGPHAWSVADNDVMWAFFDVHHRP